MARGREVVRLRLGEQGRVVIPGPIRRALGLSAGDELVALVDDARLVIRSRRSLAGELRGVLKGVAPGRSLVDELIEERGRERS